MIPDDPSLPSSHLQLPYKVIEVNPLYQTELKWSTYKKVPVLKFGDDEVLVGYPGVIGVSIRGAMFPALRSWNDEPQVGNPEGQRDQRARVRVPLWVMVS